MKRQRHSFEIYYDQYDRLIQLAATDRMAGGNGSMSAMVRDAIDRLIAERKRGATEPERGVRDVRPVRPEHGAQV